ncbi:MAG: hypothetical protein J6S59_02995 [Clostridia bacterium]|nr:hypothetical protein [Clostridia bacterium]
MKALKLLFTSPFRSLSPKWKAARIVIIAALVVLAALIFDLGLLAFLEKAVNRAGDISTSMRPRSLENELPKSAVRNDEVL